MDDPLKEDIMLREIPEIPQYAKKQRIITLEKDPSYSFKKMAFKCRQYMKQKKRYDFVPDEDETGSDLNNGASDASSGRSTPPLTPKKTYSYGQRIQNT